jgi:hypothetical protein
VTNSYEINNIRDVLHSQLDPLYNQLINAPKEQREEILENWCVHGPKEDASHLLPQVQECRAEISHLLEMTRTTLVPVREVELCATQMWPNGTYQIDPAALRPIEDGISGSYFLVNPEGVPKFVVKPMDEDISALNNPKGYGCFYFENMFDMQLYRAVFREMAVSSMAKSIGVSSVAPETALAILESERFFDVADIEPTLGPKNKEKLCSCMEFIPNSQHLGETLQTLQQMGLSDEEIRQRFDQDDFEDANILIWATGEQDAHLWNLLTCVKGYDACGNEIYGIKKIDNGLCLPENPSGFNRNGLAYMPNARLPLSDRALTKIFAMNPDAIANILQKNQLQAAIPATMERIARLKAIVSENTQLTVHQINTSLFFYQSGAL